MKIQRSVRMDKELWDLAEKTSKEKDRSVNNIIVRWIKSAIKTEKENEDKE